MIDLRNCEFGFKCTANWDEMTPTVQQGVRHCEECKKNVYFVTKPEELALAISLNRCVAIAPLQSKDNLNLDRPTLGVPKRPKDEFSAPRLEDSDVPFFVGKIDRTK